MCRRRRPVATEPPRPATILRQSLGPHVRLAMYRCEDVRVGLEAERAEDARALARKRRESGGGIGHHVADDVDRADDAFVAQRGGRALVGCEEECRDAVDLDPVSLLGHRQVAAPQPCFDVRDRDAGSPARAPARVELVSP